VSTHDTLAERHPVAADRILSAATLGVLLLPAATILAILSGHPILAQVATLASAGSYAVGYTAATIRYRRRCREAVAEARRDPLTGLPNRAVADAILTAATTNRTRMTVALIDVDGLHAVNTSLGHAAGDQYLTAITTRLAAAVPDGGCLVRQGGDEFTLLAPDTDPTVLATAIGAALAGRATIAGHHMQPRASVGIADSGDSSAADVRFDAGHARGCADAALYSAKAAGGNRILVYDPDRDGTPEPDGSRPLLRRRDIDPLAADGVAWLPSPSRNLVPLLLPIADLRTIHHVLGMAVDRWAQTAAEADADAQRPGTPTPPAGDSINIEPTPGGYRSIAHLAHQQATSYTRLAQRLAPIIDATTHVDDPATPPGRGPDLAAAVLVGISAAFTPAEIETLVITAADAVHGHLDELSRHQWELAARAYTLLHDADA
jgi:diguanylate cyclase (GGDEF)-like protein